ncbi:MAG: hypothetical protein ABJA74_10525 [Lapillicoccus sp.]
MSLYAGEPDLGPWEPQPAGMVVSRGAGGKSAVADRLAAQVDSVAVVHTDGSEGQCGFFDWDELLVDGVLAPLSRGEARHTRRQRG